MAAAMLAITYRGPACVWMPGIFNFPNFLSTSSTIVGPPWARMSVAVLRAEDAAALVAWSSACLIATDASAILAALRKWFAMSMALAIRPLVDAFVQ